MGNENVKPVIGTDPSNLPVDSTTNKIDIARIQLEEYFEYSHPDSKNDEKSKIDYVNEKLTDLGMFIWVFFPSRNTLIRMLSEKYYRHLTASRNRNLIDSREQDLLISKDIAVAGMSVGGTIFQALVQGNIGSNYRIADHDALDSTNLNRLQTSVLNIGRNKVDIAAEQAYLLNPYIAIDIYNKGLNESNVFEFVNGASVVFEAIDDFKMKILLRYEARKMKIPLVMLTSLGDNVLIDIERYDLDPNQPIFHGILNDLPEKILKMEIGEHEKVRLAIELVEEKYIPTRALASLLCINKSLNGRPQLGSTINIDAGLAAFIARGIFGDDTASFSGRFYLDLNKTISARTDKEPTNERKKVLKALGYT